MKNKIKIIFKGTIIHKIHTKYMKFKTKLIGELCKKSLSFKKKYLEKKFKKRLGYELNFRKNPETYNQKIQFRKIFDRNPLYSLCSDKYLVREYVAKKIGEEYLIPLHLVTDEITGSQYDKLPECFIAKGTNGSGTNKIVFNKNLIDKKKTIREINSFLKIKYGTLSLEKYYDEIKPRIIVEELLGDGENLPKDYKIHCFKNDNDLKMFIQVDEGRFKDHKRAIFDSEWKRLNMKHCSKYPLIEECIKPKNFEEMKEVAKKLSEDFEYVRVDVYNLEGKIYFGELTFCHGSGFENFEPESIDYEWGSYWK